MDTKPTILVVDDTKENINILLSLLKDYDVVVALNGEKALKMVEKYDVDLILLDIVMPQMSGYEVCEELKGKIQTKKIPILFITANTDDASIEKAFKLGGVDYVTKPFRPIELLARVKTHLELSNTLKKLEYAATRDGMTGIYNRAKFFELGQTLLRSQKNLFAVMIDIDNFKNINDSYGHPFGDKVIKKVVNTIRNNIHEDTILARLGGEEFALLIQSDVQESVMKEIDTMRHLVSQEEEIFANDVIVKFTISNGVATKNENDTLDSLMKRADEALYDAKKSGRNKVCYKNFRV
nr:diguanylate cyclase [Sulfurimonas sp. SAG-AH-194-I05]